MTRRSGHPRIACCIEGCRRGTTTCAPLPQGCSDLETGGTLEWICGPHWRRVPRALKRRRQVLRRQWVRRRKIVGGVSYWHLRPGSPERIQLVMLERLIRACWARCKAHAAGDLVVGVGEMPAAVAEELRRLAL